MPSDVLLLALFLWFVAAILGLARSAVAGRVALVLGAAAGIAAALLTIPLPTPSVVLPVTFVGSPVRFVMQPAALWLFGFGLVPALLAAWSGPRGESGQAGQGGGWVFGAAVSLIGALGVFGLQQGAAFLLAWELMSLGGGMMLISERLAPESGRPVLFMLALLEVGTVALLLGVLVLAARTGGLDSLTFAAVGPAFGGLAAIGVGLLFLIGFGAKLGMLPFYEWYPAAYASGSGASGAVLSGIVLNAAFFGLSQGLLDWLPRVGGAAPLALGLIVVTVGTVSAILAVLYAFQADDWRRLLSFSTAENAGIAVTMLGAALVFRTDHLGALAGLAWVVALLHLAGHALAKGGLLIAADGAAAASGTYAIRYTSLARRGSWIFGVGAFFAAMSLAALPPQAGFVSEWYVFQTLFQAFHLSGLTGRIVLSLAGAGIAVVAAVALGTFVKLFGIGILGRDPRPTNRVPLPVTVAVGLSGAGVLALAVGMQQWLHALDLATAMQFHAHAAAAMHVGLVLVPLTKSFAFISPAKLAMVGILLALIPVGILALSRGFSVRRAPVWYGGLQQDPLVVGTTALTFSNAIRTFLAFIYRPIERTTQRSQGREYFVTHLEFRGAVTPLFGSSLFVPIERSVGFLARRFSALQSGHLNFYLGLIGILFVVLLILSIA